MYKNSHCISRINYPVVSFPSVRSLCSLSLVSLSSIEFFVDLALAVYPPFWPTNWPLLPTDWTIMGRSMSSLSIGDVGTWWLRRGHAPQTQIRDAENETWQGRGACTVPTLCQWAVIKLAQRGHDISKRGQIHCWRGPSAELYHHRVFSQLAKAVRGRSPASAF
jgi:hypothetical protein